MQQIEAWFGDLAGAIVHGINAQTREALVKYIQGAGTLEGLDVAVIQIAYGMGSKALTADHFTSRTPYARVDAYQEQLEGAAARGWLITQKPGRYKLSKEGKQVVKGLFEVAAGLYSKLPALTPAEMARVIELLDQVTAQVLELPEPGTKPAFMLGRSFEPPASAPALMVVRRRLLDLRAWRDDVHIAAWKPYESNGQLWETLTLVWRGEAQTAAALAEQLQGYRYYDEKSYAAALTELEDRGWIQAGADGYQVTAKGAELRQAAEAATDRLYDAPWQVLKAAELEELKTLLAVLGEKLTPAAAAAL